MSEPDAAPAATGGHCLCGAVRFRVTGPPRFVAHCYCANCRRAHAAGAVTFAGWERDVLEVTAGDDALTDYVTETDATRSFCSRCGTTLFYRHGRWPTEVHVAVGALDESFALPAQAHVYADRARAWHPIHDDLPRYGGEDGGTPL